jgi:hypothetical protein
MLASGRAIPVTKSEARHARKIDTAQFLMYFLNHLLSRFFIGNVKYQSEGTGAILFPDLI